MNIKTEYVRKGRPGYNDPTCFDWSAWDDDLGEDMGVGLGPTEESAIADLKEKLDAKDD